MTSESSTQAASDSTQPTVKAPILIDAHEVARLLSISYRTVRRLDMVECLPKPVQLLSRSLWRLDELREWVNAGCPARHRWIHLRDHKYDLEAAAVGVRSPQRRKPRSVRPTDAGASLTGARN
jgi:predicted DNA-binding transcriptional regulator AlpA